MKDYSHQQEEIKTIKERTITLKLSDADTQRITEKAATVGLSVSELLENFIGDLVDGTYSNGSDERMLANDWFERCGFSLDPRQTFLAFLIGWDNLKPTLDTLEYIAEREFDLGEATEEEEKKAIKEELFFQWGEIDDYYKEYAETVKNPQPYEKAIESLQEYRHRLEAFQNGGET